MPKFNFGEMDGANVQMRFGHNEQSLMSKFNLDEKEERNIKETKTVATRVTTEIGNLIYSMILFPLIG